MKYLRKILFFLFLLSVTEAYSQEPEIEGDSILIKLTVTSQENEKLETIINFENTFTHKVKSVKTDKKGEANLILYTDEKYIIKIPNSNDSYEYSIPEFSISPLALNLKFGIKEKK